MNPRKDDRNKQMLKDRDSGMMLKEMSKKYGLSVGRISLIISHQRDWETEGEKG